ncbi:MAG: methanogenesis marker 16 metalloprotein [Candidatus Lokiarchaeota archaeon]|nr:methanogenesis marker 16 metalloprotein [Candidatus Lokiarchaeota archaeon]MBD3198692.1 methanogenesis marker 16 metalloprotein [Candidatus Lokiarchaeota archaeon]
MINIIIKFYLLLSIKNDILSNILSVSVVAKKRTLKEINSKIEKGIVRIFTVQELIDKLEKGEKINFEDVDVITTATKALMSGIAGIFSFRLSPPKKVRKFVEVSINGIQGFPGPCPNEFLGIIDLILYGTAKSETREDYSGGMLFRDLVEGKEVNVKAKSVEGIQIEKTLTLKDFQFARLMGTRQAIRNYFAMVNPTEKDVETIFSVLALKGNFSQLTFSGCGAMNPFQNDPNAEILGIGTKILVNGQIGYIMGPGTRNDRLKPNLQTISDMNGMDPEFMGSFKTSYGPESICSIAVPIPILNEGIWNNIVKSDHEVPLTVLNVVGRFKVGEITYGDVWHKNFVVKFYPDKCVDCDDCPVDGKCPTRAFDLKKGIDRSRCFNCGTCYYVCPEDAFDIDLKSVKVKLKGMTNEKTIPVVLRQSDRNGAIKLAERLKKMILQGEFKLKEAMDPLEFYPKVF